MRVGSFEESKIAARKHSGFTLVELLVVMSVIAVLAAIIFPIITKAKEQAYINVCLSNMKQVGAGLQMYMNQYDDRFPAAAPWGSQKYWQTSSLCGTTPQKTIQELLNNYVKSGSVKDPKDSTGKTYEKRGVFICPSDTGLPVSVDFPLKDYRGQDNIVNGVYVAKPIWKYSGCSYEYFSSNQHDYTNPDEPKIIKWSALSPFVRVSNNTLPYAIGAPLSAIKSSSKKAVLCDVWYWHMGDQIPGPRVGYRNTLFADGHARRIRGSENAASREQVLKQWHADSLTECTEEELKYTTTN